MSENDLIPPTEPSLGAYLVAIGIGALAGLGFGFCNDARAATIRDVALKHCPTHRAPPVAVVDHLLAVEKRYRLPPGLMLAAACHESAFRADPGLGDGGRSAGMFQFGSWAKRRIKSKLRDPRLDWRAAADFWARHVRRQLRWVRRHCKGRGGYRTRRERLWASANATAVRSPRKDKRPHCARKGRNETKHWRTLRRWRSRIKTGYSMPPARKQLKSGKRKPR